MTLLRRYSVGPSWLLALLLTAGGLLGACQEETPASDLLPRQQGKAALAALPLYPHPPDRDLLELAQRLRGVALETVPQTVNPTPPAYALGDQRSFWVTDLQQNVHFTVTATLRHIVPHAYLYVQDGVEVDQEALRPSAEGLRPSAEGLRRAAQEFEDHIYPTVRRYFGQERSPGLDNDPRLTILNARIPGVAGYFSVADAYPRAINPFSNEREMFYMSLGALRPGSRGYNAVLAHEFQHAVHWNQDPNEEAWVSEGLAELASELVGFGPAGGVRSFTQNPDTQLTAWPDDPAKSGPHYGASYLFLKYLIQNYGGTERLKDLTAEPADGIEGINAFLAKGGYREQFEDVFADWVVSNALGKKEGRYGYDHLDVRVTPETTVTGRAQTAGTVHQYAAAYIELRPTQPQVTLIFTGTPTVKLLPNDPLSGRYQWWGHRGDAINTTLTRSFDLSGLERATLTFWAWYDIEKNWNHAYVEVSTDRGKTWSILKGIHTTEDNPLGSSFGPAYTGRSGGGEKPVWVKEEIDLSAYAGKQILLRFEYVTDEAVHNPGFALEDIAIPELGYFHDAEAGAGGWEARGFVRTDNSLPQNFVVQVIQRGRATAVVPLPLDASQRGQLTLKGFGQDVESATLVVAALAPLTTEPATYEYAILLPEP